MANTPCYVLNWKSISTNVKIFLALTHTKHEYTHRMNGIITIAQYRANYEFEITSTWSVSFFNYFNIMFDFSAICCFKSRWGYLSIIQTSCKWLQYTVLPRYISNFFVRQILAFTRGWHYNEEYRHIISGNENSQNDNK